MDSDVFKAYLEKYLPEILEKLIRTGRIRILNPGIRTISAGGINVLRKDGKDS